MANEAKPFAGARYAPDPALLEKAGVLVEALPYLQRYAGDIFVIKFGGNAMGDAELARNFARDVVLLKQVGIRPVVVHGGGPQIGSMLKRLGLESRFVDGLRVTDKATADVAEMVLGAINKEIVADIARAGGHAVGLSGKDADFIEAHKVAHRTRDPGSNIEQAVDLGFVGHPGRVNRHIIDVLTEAGFIPVVAPVAPGTDGATYNINADTCAGAIAAALEAERFFLLTDVPGVLSKDGALLSDLTPAKVGELVADGTISGGMIPKIETCVAAVEEGVTAAVILDGRVAHAMLLEIFTDKGAGSLIHRA